MGSDKKKRKREEKEAKKHHKKKKDSSKKKKHKKEHKHSSSSSSSKKRHKKEQQQQSTGGDDGGGGLRLPVKGLVSLFSHHPHVAKELYLVMRALEDGQGVALDGIPVLDLRRRMGSLLESCGLPTRLEGISVTTTYYLPPPQQQQSGCGEWPLLRAALAAIDQALGPLPDVSGAQSCVDGLLARFPVLSSELPGLLARVAAGERVVVSGLEDEALRSGLVRVFEALGLGLSKEGEEEEEGYGLVRGPGRSEQRAKVKELIVRNGGEAVGDDEEEEEEEEVQQEGGEKKKDAEEEEAGAAAVEGVEGGPQEEAVAVVKKVVGPAMPDAAVLAEAQARAAEMMEEGGGGSDDEDDDDDDVVGPSLDDGRAAVPDHIAYRHLESGKRAKGGREEWMTMGPGVPSLANLQPSMKGRQFNQRSERAKQAQPAAEKRVLTASQIREMEADAAKERGRKTLLQQHQEKAAKGGAAKKEEPLARKAWSREEFIEGQKAMDQRSANKLFEAAKELGTRFSRSFR